jgi:hypothetical protein
MSQVDSDPTVRGGLDWPFRVWYPVSLLLYAAVLSVAVLVADVLNQVGRFDLGHALTAVLVSAPALLIFFVGWAALTLPFVWFVRGRRWPARLLGAVLLLPLTALAASRPGALVTASAGVLFALLMPLPRRQ